jgi:hypothetical protein
MKVGNGERFGPGQPGVVLVPLLAVSLVGYALTPPLVRRAANPLTLDGHERFVTAVAVTPDGQRGVSGGEDDTIRV